MGVKAGPRVGSPSGPVGSGAGQCSIPSASAEQALRQSEQRLRAIIETTPECVKLVAADGTLLEMNPAGLAMIEAKSACDVIGKCAYDLVAPQHREAYRVFNEQVCQGVAGSLEFEVIGLKGRRRWMESRSVPLDNPADGARVQLAVARDITERRAAEAALSDANRAREAALKSALEAARMKSEFLANTSHEIRTPLNAVLGMTELLLETELSVEQRDYVETIKSSSDALLTILNDVLDFSKMEAGRLDLESIPFGLRSAVRDTLKALAIQAHKKGLELACRIPPDVPDALLGDPGRLRQILVNLVGNALKFTEKGEVTVSVNALTVGDDWVDLNIAVADTGIGIPETTQGRIFDAFVQADGSTTRKYGGTGLGLAIVGRLVALMGGRVRVESQVGKGSTFHVRLRFEQNKGSRAAMSLAQPETLRGLHALVVDDNETNRRILSEMLRSWGIHPKSVDSAPAALAALDPSTQERATYSFALLDSQMPDMDGFELAERIKADPELAGVKLIVLTSSGLRGDAARCKALGIAGYLTKPVMASDLLEAIQTVVGAPELPPGDPLVTRHFLRETRARLQVLLADDNPVNRLVARKLLERQGHSVHEVGDGLAAVKAIDSMPFDLVLLDLQMPGLDGIATTAAIREREAARGGRVPVIALTAHALPGDRELCLAAGMDGHVAKPVDAQLLAGEIERLLPSTRQDAAHGELLLGNASTIDVRAILSRVDGDVGLLAEIVQIFLSDANVHRSDIRRSLERGDARGVERAAHRLRGSLGTLAARPAEDLAQRIESAARAGRIEDVDHLVICLEREIDRLEPELTALGGGKAPR